jgi:hypothetical protein
MEIGDWILIILLILGILIGSGYLQKNNPGTYSVVGNAWEKATTGAYDLFTNFVTQMKTPKTNATIIPDTGGTG